uniref:Uncharacterized protein n=1 Tax=Chenopodium quinoa TaxID=63459 RepID=A0A803MWB8_CHEQI
MSNQKVQVKNSALVEDASSSRGCFHSHHNMSIQSDLLKFSMNHGYGYVFPNCPKKDLEEKCNGGVIEVPYIDEGLTKAKVLDMLQRGVLLHWKAYTCTACLESGGK